MAVTTLGVSRNRNAHEPSAAALKFQHFLGFLYLLALADEVIE
jgi:hypothetical protein